MISNEPDLLNDIPLKIAYITELNINFNSRFWPPQKFPKTVFLLKTLKVDVFTNVQIDKYGTEKFYRFGGWAKSY